MPKNALVVGMPRSGTSLTASVFANNGYFAAESSDSQLRREDENNPMGYWEADDLIEANVELFNTVGYPEHNTWRFSAISQSQGAEISRLAPLEGHRELVARYDAHAPWIWKDPRLCYTLGYWWNLVDQANTGVLLIRRNKAEIYRSFVRLEWRDDTERNKLEVYRRIDEHLAAVERDLKEFDIPYIEIDYRDYKLAPEETAEKLSRHFDLPLTSSDLGFESKFNSSTLRGRMTDRLESLAFMLPDGVRKGLKAAMPGPLLRLLFPKRFR